MENVENKDNAWSSRIGFIFAAAGSAVGLGNIWRLPYLVSKHGGGTFLFLYLLFSFTIALSVLIAEFTIGRYCGAPVISNLRKKIKGSFIVSKLIYIYPLALIFLLSFYFVVSGWTLFYFCKSIIGAINYSHADTAYYTSIFNNLLVSPYTIIGFTILFVLLTGIVVYIGISGIEKINFIMLPLIFILLTIVIIKVLTLDGSMSGIKYIFSFDPKFINREAITDALGQSFFALSLGSGTMLVFASYAQKNYNIKFSAIQTTNFGVGVGIFSTFLIIPAAFAFNVDINSGAGLTFITLPVIFSSLPLGVAFAAAFFLVMVMAALTSTISVLEVCAVFLADALKISKKAAIIIFTIFFIVVGSVQALSFGIFSHIRIFGQNTFDFANMMVNFLLVVGGILSCAIAGWLISKKDLYNEITNNGLIAFKSFTVWRGMVKFIIPFVIVCIYIFSN